VNQWQADRSTCTAHSCRCVASASNFFLPHIHDEACMGLRSQERFGQPGGRYSKIQNNVFRVETQEESLRVFTELPALGKKDALTIATAMAEILDGVLACLLRGAEPGEIGRVRILHIVTADAVATNDAACRRLWPRMLAIARSRGFRFYIVAVKCASHQGNLVVQIGSA
jgi:hypothetical protein